MNKNEMMERWEVRKSQYANQWKTGLISACCADPGCCCLALLCPTCASYSLRKRALHGDLRNYRCCGGFLPCANRCSEASCPELCLGCEVFCCFSLSVAVTRWMIQDELRVQNSACDNCLYGTTIFLYQLACICQIAACLTGDDTLSSLADLIRCIADVFWCSVCACMQTQHKVQLDERDRTGGGSGDYYMQNPSPIQAPVPQPAPMYQAGPTGYPVVQQAYPPQYSGQPQYPPPGYPQGYQQQMYR